MTAWLFDRPALLRALAGLVVLGAVAWLTVGPTRSQAAPQQLDTEISVAAQAAGTVGDVDCDNHVGIGDAQKTARSLISLPVTQNQPCPLIGSSTAGTPSKWGDVDCDNHVGIGDAQKIARSLINLPVTQEPGCPPIGSSGTIETTLTQAAIAGQNEIQVASVAGFAIGDYIRIDAGTPAQEDNRIAGFGPMRLASALLHDHAVGAMVLQLPVPLSALADPVVNFYHGPLPLHEMPKEVSPGHDFTFTLTFENTGPGPGYGPYIDLYLPALGIDDESTNGPCDGITFVKADALLASPPTYSLNTFPASGHAIRPTAVTTTTPAGTPSPMSCTKPVSVASIGGPITPLNVHPFGGAIPVSGSLIPTNPGLMAGPGGYELVVIELPFGSYYPTQGKTYVDVKAHVSDHADANQALTIFARGGFRFGDSQLGTNPPVPIQQLPFVHEDTTPVPFTISKVCTLLSGAPCPENETATGPNFPMYYVITVDIDDGLTINPLIVEDILPDNVHYADNLHYTGGVVTTPPSVIQEPSLTLPGGLLHLEYDYAITGTAAPNDIVVTFQFYIPANDAAGLPILDAGCSPATAINDVLAVGTWQPIDARDQPLMVTSDSTHEDHTLLKKCIAMEKTSSPPPGAVIPGNTITYTLNFQVSDYLQMGHLVIKDLLSDGQHFNPGSVFLTVTDKTGALASVNVPVAVPSSFVGAVTNASPCPGTTPWPFPPHPWPFPPPQAGGGLPHIGTTMTFDVSGAVSNLYPPTGGPSTTLPSGILTGGQIPPTGAPGATGTLTFQTVVQDKFDCPVPDDWVDKFDRLYDYVTIEGDVVGRADQAYSFAAATDDSGAVVPVAGDSIKKCIYSIERPIGTFVLGPPSTGDCAVQPTDPAPQITPGDVVTFRILKTIPAGDYEHLAVTDLLPHPVLQQESFTSGPGPSNNPCLYAGGPNTVPPPTTSLTENSVSFDYGGANDPNNLPCDIDILLGVTVTGDPYADGLLFTNEARECEDNSLNETICQAAIAPMELTEPRLRITKGVVAACQPAGPPPASCTPAGRFISMPVGPAGVTFLTPGTAIPSFAGTIASGPPAGLAVNPINSNANLDAGDIATFAVVVENYGSGLNGAFDLKINDSTIPPSLTAPTGGYNFGVTDGTGAAFTCVPVCDGTNDAALAAAFFSPAGVQLDDPGPTLSPAGGLDPHHPTSGRNIAVITYDLQVKPDAAVGACFNNTATILNYAGIEGGADHTDAVFGGPYTDTAQVCIRPSVTKSIVTTSEAHTPGTPNSPWIGGVEQLTIGEIVRYRLDVVVPEGVSTGFQVKDVLPAGLSFMPGTDGLAIFNFTSSINPHSTITGGAFDCSNAGTDPVFNVDDLSNPGTLNNLDQDPDQEILRIEFSALVCNVPVNTNGAQQDDHGEVSVNGSLVAISNTVPAVIVEPHVSVVKQVVPHPQQAGNWIYTITLTSNGTADAFDIHLTDPLPQNCSVVANTLTLTPSSPGVVGIGSSSTTASTVVITIDGFPASASLAIKFTAKCDVPCDNSAGVAWTSLPGPFGTTLNPTHSATPGAGGASDGERDGTGGVNDYTTSAGTAGPPCGTAVTVIKDAVPDDPLDFPFTTTGGLTPSVFTLDDDPGSTTPTDTQTFTNVSPGTYTVQETLQPGWAVSISCVGATLSVLTFAPDSVRIFLVAGEHVVCTFTNTPTTEVDIGGKYNTPPGAAPEYGFDLYNLGPRTLTQIHIVDPLPAGVTFGSLIPPSSTGWDCTASTSAVVDCTWTGSLPPSFANGVFFQFSVTGTTTLQNCATVTTLPVSSSPSNQTVICDHPYTCGITIVENSVPDGPQDFGFSTFSGGIVPNLTPSHFTLDDDTNGTLSNTQTFTNVSCGAYTISETALPPGWTLAGATCTGTSWSANTNGVTINLGVGASITCTFTNT